MKSEIRKSHIDALHKIVKTKSHSKYLSSMKINKLRAFNDAEISFDFPVTAIIGPNGSGKTTVLGAAGIAYSSIAPSDFFAKSGAYDESMQSWSVEYSLLDKSLKSKSASRTANFKKFKWNRKALEREVNFFGISRTLPATERSNLNKAKGAKFKAIKREGLSSEVIQAAEKILGKKLDGYEELFISESSKNSFFMGKSGENTYSEFHFGAGEASIIRIVHGVENSSESSLVLIEELENGLHPVATRRLVDYLMAVALEKKIQVIFSTHSNDALSALPDEAIWASINGNLIQGKLDIEALRTVSGEVDTKLAIYVEDDFAQLLVKRLLSSNNIDMEAVQVHGVGGCNPAISYNEQRNNDPASSFKSICILDGDQAGNYSDKPKTFFLPGNVAPDAYIFEYIMENLSTNIARLQVALGVTNISQKNLKSNFEEVHAVSRDHHTVYSALGEKLNFLSEEFVQTVLINEWIQNSPDASTLFEELKDLFVDAGIIKN